MNLDALLLLAILSSSLIPGLVIFGLPEERHRLRTLLNLAGAFVKLSLVGVLFLGVYSGHEYAFRLPLLPGLDLVLHADALSLLFIVLSAFLWFVTTVYAVGYLEGAPNRSRFFGFFSLCVSATTGIALAGDLVTFVIFYEMLTISTFPLVVHRGTPEALRAGRIYLAYTLSGGVVLLVATAWLRVLAGPLDFVPGGFLAGLDAALYPTLQFLFGLLMVALGVKSALVPLHSWLPTAMVAPAPVSALLHAVAVVKAGAFGIARVVYDVYGIGFALQLGVLLPLAALAAVTIVYGSVRALFQDDLKRRLAFSTVSQVAYIVLGVAIAGPLATIGGLVHLVHQGMMKITLFFCAGNLAETLGIHKISEMAGVGRRMPWTMAAFTLGALGMIGVPPMVGFISKWYLALGGLEAGQSWVVVLLVVSTLLNAAYFLPILYTAWFGHQHQSWPHEHLGDEHRETTWALLLPPLITAALVVLLGVFASAPLSPLQWVQLIAAREYGP
ncbi:proton-conducting transporter transmembrane domain-containing protein [Geoalkalibacter halelectricus]|uniref:Monovalent cation/H+ antiporter subunit D family protein n=1 Tax=Geoalkalibacter halelectricus TaxID=2847045 RepID=A0ABY5ZHE9_9BACT|nr:proton-conducting transporter membrane subunit [Geoalkalibacter halelectricus]MDO3377940.1 monovalent cation/H+ antiporter subunit D family protein [Geoalkalibacter halelectricus]UWZ77879.1 monovalent cation/H+ antiporter subunit D family protein [Geoalkalibacter halelectricus]